MQNKAGAAAAEITILYVKTREGTDRHTVTLCCCGAGGAREDRALDLLGAFLPFSVEAGMVLSEDEADALLEADEVSRAVVKGADLLDYADQTEKVLTQKLRQRGFSAEAAEQAVQYLAKRGMLREEALMVRTMHYLCEKKYYGPGRVGMELVKKGFSRSKYKESYESTMAELDFDRALRQRIRVLGAEHLKNPQDERRQRSYAALLRYGFSPADIRRVLNEVE